MSRAVYAPESLFNPSIMGQDGDLIQSVYASCLSKIAPERRRVMAMNTVMTGGTTLIPGFDE